MRLKITKLNKNTLILYKRLHTLRFSPSLSQGHDKLLLLNEYKDVYENMNIYNNKSTLYTSDYSKLNRYVII